MPLTDHILDADLERRLQFERLLADLTARFVGLPPSQVQEEIEGALQQLCNFLGFDRSTIWEFDSKHRESAHLRHAFQVSNGPPLPQVADATELFPWVNERLRRGEPIVLERMDDLPEEASVDKENFERFRSKSVVILPLQAGGNLLGIVTFAMIHQEKAWPEAIVRRLRLCAQVFAEAIDRRRVDLALRESEERFSLAMEAAGAGLWSMDIETQKVWANARIRELYQFAPDEDLTFESFLEAIEPEDRDLVHQAVQTALESGVPMAAEFRANLPDGSVRWLAAHGRCRGGRGGDCGRLIGLAYDISERRQAEELLRDLNRQLILAHEEERARLARELHDDLTQRLARMAIDLGVAGFAEDGSLKAASRIRSVREDLARLSEDVHTLAYRLHPTILEDLGLEEALRTECERFERRESIATEQELCKLSEVTSRETSLCLFRVAQECLRNVARHAEASQVVVSMCDQNGGLQLTVEDDGIGFDPAGRREKGHLGIAGMRERVILLSGEFHLDSDLGKGTKVSAWVPLKESPS